MKSKRKTSVGTTRGDGYWPEGGDCSSYASKNNPTNEDDATTAASAAKKDEDEGVVVEQRKEEDGGKSVEQKNNKIIRYLESHEGLLLPPLADLYEGARLCACRSLPDGPRSRRWAETWDAAGSACLLMLERMMGGEGCAFNVAALVASAFAFSLVAVPHFFSRAGVFGGFVFGGFGVRCGRAAPPFVMVRVSSP